jgi:exonuclease-1
VLRFVRFLLYSESSSPPPFLQYVVAPYEADPQLCYLEKTGHVDAIITEDSDLLVFGCREVLFKMDGEGNCVSISRDDFSKCREYNLAGWSDAEFRQMAILSGCDYAGSIVGLGLKTAYKLMRKYKTAEKVRPLPSILSQLPVESSH